MTKVFHPDDALTIYVPASSPPHPEGTEYRVAIGIEKFSGTLNHVLKVQMRYKGRVAGMLSPSYPIGTDDYERVQAAIAELLR